MRGLRRQSRPLQCQRTYRDNQQAGSNANCRHQYTEPIAHNLRLIESIAAKQITDKNAARIAKAKTQTDQQILDDIRNGIGRHRIRTKMTHNHGVHGETATPNQLIAQHGQTILPKILLQRHIRMQHHRQPQTCATIAAGYKHRPHQFNGTGNHRGNRSAENTQCR